MSAFGLCKNCGSRLRLLDKCTFPHFQPVDAQRQELLEEQQVLAEQLVDGIEKIEGNGPEDVNELIVRQRTLYGQWQKIVLKLARDKTRG